MPVANTSKDLGDEFAARPKRATDWRAVLNAAPYPVRQAFFGAGYLLVPRRLPGLLPLAAVTLRDLPKLHRPLLPDPRSALTSPDGLCGLTGRIAPSDLVEGYRRGMFVMSHIGPLKWWAPRHRMVLFFDQARVEKTARRLLRTKRFDISFDRAFAQVVRACGTPRSGGTPLTWITPRVERLFVHAHRDGHAHSVEVWEKGELVGGAFGLAVGQVFFTESQFHTARDASKVGFSVLNRHLQSWGFALNDCKHPTRYLADWGMQPITRADFSDLTTTFGARPGHARPWAIEPALLDDGWEPGEAGGLRRQDVLPAPSECPGIQQLLTTHRSPTW